MSASIYKTIIKAIMLDSTTSNTNVCSLCLQVFDGDGISGDHEVVIPPGGDQTEILANVLDFLVGGFTQISDHFRVFKLLCKDCTATAITCYKFLQNSVENINSLRKALDNLEMCLEDISADNDEYRTLYLSIKPKETINDLEIEKYYEKESLSVKSKVTALERLKKKDTIIYDQNYHRIKLERDLVNENYFDINNHDPIAYKCKVCFKTYCNVISLRKHFLKKHEIFDCTQKLNDQISVSYKRKKCNNLRVRVINELGHQENCQDEKSEKKHLDPRRGNFYCDYCGYHAYYKFALARHVKFEHKGEKGYVCEWCAKNCYTPSALKAHLLKHTKEKEFVCTECGGKFVNLYSLNNHIKNHTGERPYPCRHCDRAFKNSSIRLEHIRRFHSAPSLQCDVCLQMFKAKASLLQHKKRHLNANSRINKRLNKAANKSFIE